MSAFSGVMGRAEGDAEMRDMKLRDHLLQVENARHENAEQYFVGWGGKCGA